MRIWRLVHQRWQHAAFDGEGSYRFGGRWTPGGVRCVYTSGSSALALLEVLVHMEKRHLGTTHRFFAATLADTVAVRHVDPDDLPASWSDTPAPVALHRIGKQWADDGATAVLRVPSAIVPGEDNYLLNPAHPDFRHIIIGEPIPFAFDRRLWKP